jgi:hypothetical protein
LGIAISGFFDWGYQWSSNRPGSRFENNISGRYFDRDHNKFQLNDFNLTIEKPEKDWGIGFKLVGDFGRSGELLREATLWHRKLQDEGMAELREAFLTGTIPVGEGIQVKAGKFVTPLGTEILPAPGAYNDNISRSFAFNLAVPLTHKGVLFTYPFAKIISASAGVVNGWDNPRDNNNSRSFLGGVNYTPADAFGLASNIIVGPEQKKNTGNVRMAWSNVATLKPIEPMTIYLEYTLGFEEHAFTPLGRRDAWWKALAGIVSYNWTERFNTAFRAEYFRDSQGARTGVSDFDVGELTLTAAYKFTAKLLGRAEIRGDFGDHDAFVRRNNFNGNSGQVTLAAQAIWGF